MLGLYLYFDIDENYYPISVIVFCLWAGYSARTSHLMKCLLGLGCIYTSVRSKL